MATTGATRNLEQRVKKASPRKQGGDTVGILVIKCPTTSRDIPIGIETDRASFTSAPVFFSRTYCPICRTSHEWFAK